MSVLHPDNQVRQVVPVERYTDNPMKILESLQLLIAHLF